MLEDGEALAGQRLAAQDFQTVEIFEAMGHRYRLVWQRSGDDLEIRVFSADVGRVRSFVGRLNGTIGKGQSVTIEDISVDCEQRKRGLGSRLLCALIDLLPTLKRTGIRGRVVPRSMAPNKLIAFYKNNGFTVVPNDALPPETNVDAKQTGTELGLLRWPS